ncbi:MAG: beta-lactamase family protein [Reyranella sp.]|uniref:serine hydrolase domain-containing protein n=1 Tax=Reyranella sp. TaxID=1929291 RepID=UPI001AC52C1B|nr:serine hydrolase domain-containing protein [Reyranella sp.]MBN9086491.1 beta-lactamase family protein [Reyranella sp.]
MAKAVDMEIDGVCAAFARQESIPGLVAGVVQGRRLAHVTTFGRADIEAARPVTPDTAFRIASMTKSTTALGVLALRDQSRLALDAPLSDYVPQFAAVAPATRDSAPVTVRHLLTHTAGFVTDDPWGDRVLGMTPAALDRLIATGRLFARPPGLAFEYSNLGYALLGRVLTNVSGRPYQAFLRETILEPLGMTRTTFDAVAASAEDFAWPYRVDDGVFSRERLEPDGEVGAMGGLATTAGDYARYVAFLLDAWPARDDPEIGPVRRASVREMGLFHAPPFAPDPPVPTAYGYGLMDAADATLGRRLHHPGGLPGYGSHMLFLPGAGVGVFAFGNRTYASMSRLTVRLAELFLAAQPKPAPAAPSPWLKRAVEAVAAAYAAGRIETAEAVFAENLLLDMPAPLRNAELAALKRRLGEGRLDSIAPTHALAGRFTIACEKGRLTGTIILSPEAEPGIQKLTLAAD